jgi:integrase
VANPGVAPGNAELCGRGRVFCGAVMKLTTKRVAKLVRRGQKGKHHDGHNLYLQIQNCNNASWIFRYERDGRERFSGLGPYHTVGLAEARVRARALRLQLLDGVDPIAAKKAAKVQRALAAAKAMTFSQAGASYIAQHGAKWSSARHAAQWSVSLKDYAEPIIGALPIGEIDVALVLKVLEQKVPAWRNTPAGSLWMTRPETASRLRGRIESILDWAKARGYRSGDNPASWSIIGEVLPARSDLAKVEHHLAMDYRQLPTFMAELRKHDGTAARALEFTVLTAARTGEVTGARWSEIDLATKTWTVPADRMKVGKEHRVPLSDRAVEILKTLPREHGNDFVFIGPRRAGLSHAAMIVLFRRMGYVGITVHGFRSSFSDWCAEQTAYANHVVEQALAHTINSAVEKAYRRGDLIEKRRRLMTDWARYCASPRQQTGAEVATLRGA